MAVRGVAKAEQDGALQHIGSGFARGLEKLVDPVFLRPFVIVNHGDELRIAGLQGIFDQRVAHLGDAALVATTTRRSGQR